MEKLLGNWLGYYEDSNGCRVSFFAFIEHFAHETLIGRVKDNVVEKGEQYTSVISGKVEGSEVFLRKSYTSMDADIVLYHGELSERKISGQWYTQKDTLHLGGKFEMWQLGAAIENKHFQSDDNL